MNHYYRELDPVERELAPRRPTDQLDLAQQFMELTYGSKSALPDQESRDVWHQRLGLLVCFAGFLVEGAK